MYQITKPESRASGVDAVVNTLIKIKGDGLQIYIKSRELSKEVTVLDIGTGQ